MASGTETTIARGPRGSVPREPTSRADGVLGRIAWVLFDGTRGPFGSLVTLFIYSAYFATVVIPDPVRGQTLWSYASAIAAVLVAIGAPLVGAVADASGRRKPWIAACVCIGVPCMALLSLATPGMASGLPWVIAAIVGATASVEYAAIFYNAMLPNIAPRAQIGVLSALGLSFANVSNIIVLLFFLFAWSWSAHPLFGLDPAQHEPERAVGPIAALWWMIFGLPLFLFTADSAPTGVGKLEAIRRAMRSLADILPKLRRHRDATRFLIARMIFNEGFIVVMTLTGVYAAGMLHWSPKMLLAQGLINSGCAMTAGLVAAWLDRRIGSRASTIVFVLGCLLTNVVFATLTPTSVLFFGLPPEPADAHGLFPRAADQIFSATIAATAIFVTAGFASSRTLMAQLSPPTMQTEFFGLYALSGTVTSFFGPLAIALMTSAFHDQRAGVAVGIVFLLAGLILLTRVRADAHDTAGAPTYRAGGSLS
jgi:UMF1 family MFS transporter